MKIRLTESQFDRVRKKLNEGIENTYNRTVQIIYHYHGATLKGHEIDSIMNTSIMLKYRIEIDGREWGIKDISLSNIQGPSEIEMEVDYWPDEVEMQSANIPLQIDWTNAKTEKQTGHGMVSVGEEVEITLINDKEGNLVISEILIPTYGL